MPRSVLPRTRLVFLGTLVALAALTCTMLSAPAAQASSARLSSKTTSSYANRLLRVLNRERAAHHLRALYMNKKLVRSAHRHNLHMAQADSLSHQLPGEASLGTRISRAGYSWRVAGENIACNTDTSWHGTHMLQLDMYHEKAPYDGHRQNILSRSFGAVGIDVYYDSTHRQVWITQDFGHH